MSSKSVISRHRDSSISSDSRKEHKSRNRSRSPSCSSRKHKSKDRKRSKEKHKKSKKKKHKKKDSSSSGSSSSDSDDEELKLLQRLEAERQRLKEEKKKQKEEMKAKETPEEKRARRLREKQEKERKRRERMGWDNEYQCYTDQDNPFGDSTLTNTFVWTKKLAKEGVTSVSTSQLEALNRQKQLENKIELEKVKQRRLEREAARAAREAETAAAARAREAMQYSSWTRHEDAFHLQQARLRSQIRIRDGRAKPIDLLACYVSGGGGGGGGGGAGGDELTLHEPYACLHGLPPRDLEDLREDIQVYKQLEGEDNQAFWSDVETIVLDELGKLQRAGGAGDQRATVHRAVHAHVTQVFKGKSGAQLVALEEQIAAKLRAAQPGLDVPYWEALRSQLQAHMARARLRERHQQMLRDKLQALKQQQGVGGDRSQVSRSPSPEQTRTNAETKVESASPSRETEAASTSQEAEAAGGEAASEAPGSGDEAADIDPEEDACVAAYRAGNYSPPPAAAPPAAALAVTHAHDARARAYRRHTHRAVALGARGGAAEGGAAEGGATSAAAAEAACRAALGAAPDAAGFSAEVALAEAPLWSDKYRPRKPRYFNRVHTGFEWNKYNQTHYDMDNPPPKIVQGYKFNIFYPDLIDPARTPHFSLKPCADNPEFGVLRFHAGPPYEDIAFKIVNREWEYSYKRGFRCHFHNNVFQLWFHFKRYRYRR